MGDLLAAATSFFFAAYLLITEKVRSHVESIVLLGISLLSTMIYLGLFDIIFRIPLTVAGELKIWVGLLGWAL
jgi:drug/metabolite transporter (DMT)-like permease